MAEQSQINELDQLLKQNIEDMENENILLEYPL